MLFYSFLVFNQWKVVVFLPPFPMGYEGWRKIRELYDVALVSHLMTFCGCPCLHVPGPLTSPSSVLFQVVSGTRYLAPVLWRQGVWFLGWCYGAPGESLAPRGVTSWSSAP